MKTTVLKDYYRELEVRPAEEFQHYLSLVKNDIKRIFNNQAGDYLLNCPACENKKNSFKFSKHGFIYRECSECGTIFMSPRPTKKMLHDFFANSEGIKYWNSNRIQESASRKEHVFEPRVRWINESVEFSENSKRIYLDFYSKFSPFVESVANTNKFSKKVSYKPFEHVKDSLLKSNYEIQNKFNGDKYSVVTAFEIFDRFYNPRDVIKELKENMEVGGLLFFTTTSASGLDFQFLLKKAKNIVPPINMNIFTVEGIVRLLEDLDFEILELSTPGTLDLQILENQVSEVELPKFINDIIRKRDIQTKEAFQEFIQRARLSSHMRVLVKKK